LKFREKYPNIPRNFAGIFVRQLAVLERSPWATICFFAAFVVTGRGYLGCGKLFYAFSHAKMVGIYWYNG
jgi:hypothetical protein